MAVKDRDKHYDGLGTAGSTAETPNTVSRNLKPGDRAFADVVWQSGKPVLDSEMQLGQDALWWQNYLLRRWQAPSGWLRGQSRYDAYCDYTLESAPAGVVDDSGGASVGSVGPGSVGSGDHILPDRTLIDAVLLPRLEALVAGWPIIVEYTNTRTAGWNLVTLDAPRLYDGTEASIKRTDFLFLEVWITLVAPSVKASGSVQVASNPDLQAGDTITINGSALTAVAGPAGVDQFTIGANADATAINIANAINDVANSFHTFVAGVANSDTATIEAVTPGVAGDLLTLAVATAVVGALAASGATLTGGEDRPNKPDQTSIYRHGNVLSPDVVALPDDITDPVVNTESSQRVQVQYRIRNTGTAEAVNWKKHPDGFSNLNLGPPSSPTIYSQGARSNVASAANVGGGRYYPFVPADETSTWGNTSAVTYGLEDTGLWISGDGSEQATRDLGTLDGYVYAIPLGFVFRHNDVSTPAPGFKGWDPLANVNGAPLYQHTGYTGPLGAIPAGRSDRPDGEFADVITQNNLLDLRRHVIFPGVDLAGQLQYQLQSLLDGSLRTWQVDIASKQVCGGDSGDVSTRYLVCNEVGRGADGAPPVSGDTERGEFIRNFDHVCRRFGSQSVVEKVVFAFYAGDRQTAPAFGDVTVNPGKYVVKAGGPNTSWYYEDVLHLDLDAFDVTTLGTIFQGEDGGGTSGVGLPDPNFTNFCPPGTVISDVLTVWHDDGHYGTPVLQQVEPSLVQGLGTTHLTVELDYNERVVNGGDSGNADYQMVGRAGGTYPGSDRRIFVEVELTYPNSDNGLSDTPDHEIIPDAVVYDGSGPAGPGPVVEGSVAQRPNDFEELRAPEFRQGYREVGLEYVPNNTQGHAVGDKQPGVPVEDYIVSQATTELYPPRRLYGGGATPLVRDEVTVLARTVDTAATEYGCSSRKLALTDALSAQQCLARVRYFPQDPIPNYGAMGGGWQLSVYFRSNVPQTAGVKESDITTTGDGTLPTTLSVEPLYGGPNLWTGQVGMGSVDLGFPYLAPLDQIAINDGTSLNPLNQVAGTIQEWFFCATADITIDDFDAETGLLALHPFVQMDGQNVLDIGGPEDEQKPRKDAEFRAYYPFVDDEAYRPTVMSQPCFGAVRHKVFFPFLARAVEDSPGVEGGLLFRKNEVLLVVVSRFAELDEENNVRFTDTDNRTAAAVYRTRNLLCVVGDRVCD